MKAIIEKKTEKKENQIMQLIQLKKRKILFPIKMELRQLILILIQIANAKIIYIKTII